MNKSDRSIQILIILVLIFPVNLLADEPFRYDSKGKRDPFMPLVTGKSKVTSGLEGVELPADLNVEGIVIDRIKGSFAILNGVIVKENEESGNIKVLKINEKSVKVLINDIEYEINLKEESEKNK